jgi:GntR family transcriptional regulator/MocR family aminotransferase
MTFEITLDAAEKDPLFLQIATRVRSAITSGQLRPGARLPSSRALAEKLAIARGTVDAAYAQLADEGAIETRRSAGTVVSGTAGRHIEILDQPPLKLQAAPATGSTGPLPFQIGLPALDAFPQKLWTNLIVRTARASQPGHVADPAGVLELRQAIVAYIGAARGVRCEPEQVIITAGYQGALALVRNVLVRPGDPVWMEDPGHPMTRMALENAGARVVPVRVDAEGIRVSAGITSAPKARLAVVTPAHQFPTGAALSLPRRLSLLAWAAEAGSWIVEDDYDSEFRYAGRPLPSLKSVDNVDRVIYVGSFSKRLCPTLRLGYIVIPNELLGAFHRAARLLTNGLPPLEQRVLATFIRDGHFARHVRRMRLLYAERLRELTKALQTSFADRIEVPPTQGGLHLLARFPALQDDITLAKNAAKSGLCPTALSSLTVAHDGGQGLLLSFANVAMNEADDLAARLAAAIG